jgi:4'-phosphopantetheinyl transferase
MPDVHIWFRHTEQIDPQSIDAARATLSVGERARLERFQFQEDRRDYALAHDLLRRSLSRLAPVSPHEWTFESDAYGKPWVNPSGLAFSLSHTRGFVACAVARDLRVGLDIERIDRRIDALAIAGRFFSAPEATALERCRADRQAALFVELWTLREAYVKALGLGLSQPLTDLSFDLGEDACIRVAALPRAGRHPWLFAVFAPSPQTRMAVAASGGEAEPLRIVARSDGGPRDDDGTLAEPLRMGSN